MADYPSTPFNPGGGNVWWQRTDPSTWMLYNNPPPPAPTTTTTLPPADPGYGAASAAPPPMSAPTLAQAQAPQMAAGSLDPSAILNDPALRHGAYGELRGLDQMMRGGIPMEHLYPFIQSLIDQGILYPGAGGVGLSTLLSYGGAQAPKTQRLIDMYERYQDYLAGGNPPTRFPQSQPRILGTIPP